MNGDWRTRALPSSISLSEMECEQLISIPASLRRERGWTGARSIGQQRLIQERIEEFLAERLCQQLAVKSVDPDTVAGAVDAVASSAASLTPTEFASRLLPELAERGLKIVREQS